MKSKEQFINFLLSIIIISVIPCNVIFCQVSSADNRSGIFSFPSTRINFCTSELSVSRLSFSTVLKGPAALKDIIKLPGDTHLNTLFTSKYQYDSKNNLVTITTNNQNLPDDVKESMKSSIPQFEEDLKNIHLTVDDDVMNMEYNDKRQIIRLTMPTLIKSQISNTQTNIKTNIISTFEIIYDNSGRISSIIEVIKNNNNGKSTLTKTSIDYLSDLSFSCTEINKNTDSRIVETAIANFFFNSDGNVIKITNKVQNESGRIIGNREIYYDEYYSDRKNPGFNYNNLNLQFILGIRNRNGSFLSTNCLKKSTTKNLQKPGELSTTSIENIISDKCCIVSYAVNSTYSEATAGVAINYSSSLIINSKYSNSLLACSSVPPCPCKYDEIVEENTSVPAGKWIKTGLVRNIILPRYHYGASYEARWKPDVKGSPGQQCTYDDTQEKKLITGGMAGGSYDKSSPQSEKLEIDCEHYYADVLTWGNTNSTYFISCKNGNFLNVVSCLEYSIGWPTDNGLGCPTNIITPIVHMTTLMKTLNCEELTAIIKRVNECKYDDLINYVLGRPVSLTDAQIKLRLQNWKVVLYAKSPHDELCKILDKAIRGFN